LLRLCDSVRVGLGHLVAERFNQILVALGVSPSRMGEVAHTTSCQHCGDALVVIEIERMWVKPRLARATLGLSVTPSVLKAVCCESPVRLPPNFLIWLASIGGHTPRK
jgi:hypothetical protein